MEDVIRAPRLNDVVRLTRDVPELLLRRGETGPVRSTWFSPATAYEVEHRDAGNENLTLALLREEQVTVEDEPTAAPDTDSCDPDHAKPRIPPALTGDGVIVVVRFEIYFVKRCGADKI